MLGLDRLGAAVQHELRPAQPSQIAVAPQNLDAKPPGVAEVLPRVDLLLDVFAQLRAVARDGASQLVEQPRIIVFAQFREDPADLLALFFDLVGVILPLRRIRFEPRQDIADGFLHRRTQPSLADRPRPGKPLDQRAHLADGRTKRFREFIGIGVGLAGCLHQFRRSSQLVLCV